MLRGALRACTGELRHLQQQHQQQRQHTSSSSSSNEAATTTALVAAAKELLLELSSHSSKYLDIETLQDVLSALQRTRDYTGVAEVSGVFLFSFSIYCTRSGHCSQHSTVSILIVTVYASPLQLLQ
jgi:hypothetical protein